jgi:hypothetical protein
VPSEVDRAAIAAQLAVGFPSWIQRRVEQVSYLDRRTVRWACGVMFRWPKEDFFNKEWRPKAGEVLYVPLDLLTKEGLVGLDGTRPDDSRVPILTYEESTHLAFLGIGSVIWGRSKTKGEGPLSDSTLELLSAVTRAPRGRASNLLASVLADESSELSHVLDDEDARGLLEELARYTMLLVPAVYEPGEEAVYRYSYCKTLETEKPFRALWNRVRFTDLEVTHARLSFGWSRSFHFEVEAPNETRIPCARLVGTYDRKDAHGQPPVKQPVAEGGGRNIVDLHARRPTDHAFAQGSIKKPKRRPPLLPPWPKGAQATPANYYIAASGAVPTETQRSDRGHATAWFRLDPAGTFLTASVVSLLTLALLIVATVRLPHLEGETGAALLLALPGVALGLLTRPGEHSFATRLLSGIRFATLVVGICALITAWIIAGGYVHHQPPKGPPYSCQAGVDDINVHPAAHHTWQTTADRDKSTMACKTGKESPGHTQVGRAAKTTVLVATIVAALMTAWLALGWLYNFARPDGTPEPAVPPLPGSSAS